jgi:acetyltransferase
VREARACFSDAGVPTYFTPEDAVAAFEHMVAYRRNQALLMQAPPARAIEPHDSASARAVVETVLREGRATLTGMEVKAVLGAYGIPTVPTRVVATAEQAVEAATELGFPAVLKVLSRDISHKSDVGGVALDLPDAPSMLAAAAAMEQRVRAHRPEAVLEGFTVQPMVRRPYAYELIVGAATDPVFGPVIMFGQGGTATEIIGDRALALPPLNSVLARDLIGRTRVARLLAGYRDRPPADIDAIERTLLQLSALLADLPNVVELDINPLLADAHGVVALDARIGIDKQATAQFAIRPYPVELEQRITWEGRSIVLRPIRPEDSEQHRAFFAALDSEDIRFRTFTQVRELPPSQLARLTQIDYDREMAFIATQEGTPGQCETLGVARAIADPDNVTAEFAIILRSDLKGRGLGRLLLAKLIAYCRSRGTRELVGDTLPDNRRMLGLARAFSFEIRPSYGVMSMRLPLDAPTEAASA